MNGFLDDFLVGLVLLCGFGYATYALGPKTWRARLGMRISAAKPTGSCGGCDNCGSGQRKARAAVSGEVQIPLSTIRKRQVATTGCAADDGSQRQP